MRDIPETILIPPNRPDIEKSMVEILEPESPADKNTTQWPDGKPKGPRHGRTDSRKR